jgi:hypothetical protein
MSNALIETNFSEVEALSEAIGEGKEKQWYIQGIMAQGDVVNKNKRIYPGGILENTMQDYNTNYVTKNRAVGEAEHPKTTQVNIDRISHVIVPGSLIKESGQNWSAKAKILNTPCGNIVKGLLEGGVQIGVSTRADGAVKRNSKGIMEVQEGLKMSAIDVVFSPSAPDALVSGLMENQEYIWDSIAEADKEMMEDIKRSFKKLNKNQLNEGTLVAFKRMMEIIRNG